MAWHGYGIAWPGRENGMAWNSRVMLLNSRFRYGIAGYGKALGIVWHGMIWVWYGMVGVWYGMAVVWRQGITWHGRVMV